MEHNALFILMGECFREGMPTSRLRDTIYGFNNQKEASESHLKLIKKLNTMNYKVDIAINTYITKYDKELLSFYDNMIIFSNFTNENYNHFQNAVNHSIIKVVNNVDISKYDFIFICRLDLLLKDKLIDIFDPSVKTITYPNIMGLRMVDSVCQIIPAISEVFVIIPKKYFYSFDKWEGILKNSNIMLTANSGSDLILAGLSLNDIDFMSDRLYIGNTFQSFNPLYKINCREEHSVEREDVKGLIYNKELNIVIKE